jgi:3-hydroxybutyryl-CoA dehydrogenase
MGNGIAHVSALSGFNTFILDLNEDFLKRGLETIEGNLQRQVKKEKISQSEMNSALGKIKSITDYDDLSVCDVIIEAATENQSVKEKIFTSMDSVCKTDAILATNTSSISITAIAEVTSRPEKVIGMHFMNPVPIMKLVEVVRGKKTDDDTTNKVIEISKEMGKKPVECNDSPGFVTNRILMPMINEAVYCLMEGVGTKEAIDKIMQLGMSHPMGPLTLADLIGLDVCRDILQVLHRDLGDDKYAPCPLLEKMVHKNRLGRKTGQGFYQY